MTDQITLRLKPEEKEIVRKRAELDAIQVALAERELELVDLRSQLAAFEGRYLRHVGTLYAELDEWKARIAELQAQLDSSAAATAQAEAAHEQARRTFAEAHGKASETRDVVRSPELKGLFREVAKRIHPDLSKGPFDEERRTRFMAEANRAYESGDAEALQRILDEYQDGADAVEGEGIGVELVRIIRQISLAGDRLTAIERELATLRKSEIALLRKQAEAKVQEGQDMLADLAATVQEQIDLARKEYETLARKEGKPV